MGRKFCGGKMEERMNINYKEYEKEVIELRRYFHENPELGFKEYNTSEYIKEYLKKLGLDPYTVAGTGVVAVIKGGYTGKTVLLRADMDALPIQEENDVSYASKNPGVMHACGHDGHMAMLLVAARVLVQLRDELHGNVKLVFQPNEEIAGACYMVDEGVLENPHVDASFGVHLWTPIESGKIGLKSGPVMAEMFNFKINVMGVSCHSSAPQDGVDAILCASNIVQVLQSIPVREINPMDTTIISVCSIHGGSSTNIIPDKVVLEGSIRYLYDGRDDGMEQPRKRMERIVNGICAAYRAKAEISFEPSNYILINDEESVAFLKEKVMPEIVPDSEIIPYCTMGGEDFSEFTNRNNVPGAFIFIGTGNREKGTDHPHHCNTFNIDEETLITGVKLHVETARKYLQ